MHLHDERWKALMVAVICSCALTLGCERPGAAGPETARAAPEASAGAEQAEQAEHAEQAEQAEQAESGAAAAPGAADLERHEWKQRLILIFAPSPKHEAYVRQRRSLSGMDGEGAIYEGERMEQALRERDLLSYHVMPPGIQGSQIEGISRGVRTEEETTWRPLNDDAARELRERFDVGEEDFQVILVGKDGTEKLRKKGEVLEPERLFEVIDAMPMRKREMREGG